ncbi:phosphatidylserine/phosphatidylglycerophosphate/cardiolipin synthase family protein [Kocuria atrinae]|uniref:phospholipase D-like domain-containing protein n=1 Tax=Kocuria atrinae TaxID=592377 RepID=UPI0002FCB724|nr:phospholipase D-like domain-containing protein [Kocuria atrinae]
MKTRAAAAHRKGRSLLFKTGVVAAGSLAAAQATVIASLAGLDWWKHRDRKVRDAPRPGTFTAHVEESEINIYTSGDSVYDDMLEAINGAQESIHMETFIWKNDEVGQRFLDALNAAADRGVDVYVIYDGFANLVIPNSFYKFSDNVNVFRMPVVWRKWWRGLLRYSGFNHSKILVVDDNIGFVGGYNIGSIYANQWRDTHVREIGPAVWGLRNSIARVWNEERDPDDQIEWIPPQNWDPEVRVAANLPVQLVYPIRHLYLSAIERAKDHIWITTPYFIPDQQILEALMAASKRGVDVKVMVPKDSNHILADWVSRGFYGQLLDAGVTILLYAASMIHAKTATIDGEWSTVGTANIDRLSLSFNYETNVEIVDPDFAAEMEKVFKADTEHCEILSSPRWRDRHPMARFAETVLIPLRPIL